MADVVQMLPAPLDGAALFYALRDAGLFDAINTVLLMNLREIDGRQASPTADVIDSQSSEPRKAAGFALMRGEKVKA